jgi:hypothetical protein
VERGVLDGMVGSKGHKMIAGPMILGAVFGFIFGVVFGITVALDANSNRINGKN